MLLHMYVHIRHLFNHLDLLKRPQPSWYSSVTLAWSLDARTFIIVCRPAALKLSLDQGHSLRAIRVYASGGQMANGQLLQQL